MSSYNIAQNRKPFILTSHEGQQLKKKILSSLKPGRNNAMKGSELAYLLGERDDRKIRVAIGELITEGVPIASSVTEPMGFFVVSNEHEAGDYIRVLKGRIHEANKRLEDFEKATANYQPPEQLSLRV